VPNDHAIVCRVARILKQFAQPIEPLSTEKDFLVTTHLIIFLSIEVLCFWGSVAYVISAIRYSEYVLLWQLVGFGIGASAGVLYYLYPGSALSPILAIGIGLWGLITNRLMQPILLRHQLTAWHILAFRKP
jgi:hypothetical protein